MNESRDELDLDWLAFCYAAGELDAAQTAAFEALLAESQAARERLAAMVALTQHVADSPLVLPAAPQPARFARRTRERLAWLSFAAALLVAGIWVGRSLLDGDPAAAIGNGDAELASAWADSFDVPATVAAEEHTDDEESGATVDAASTGDVLAEDPLDVPDWMFAALGDDGVANESSPEESSGEGEEAPPDAADRELHQG